MRRSSTLLTLAVALVGLVAGTRPGFAEWPGAPAGAADRVSILLDHVRGGSIDGQGLGQSPLGDDLRRWLDSLRAVTLAVDTSRYRVAGTGSPSSLSELRALDEPAPYRLIDADLRGTAVSFDLRLGWPSARADVPALVGFQPYLSFGPTVFVVDSEEGTSLARPGSRPDTTMTLGLHWGAGLSWTLSKNTTLFGEYRLIQRGGEPLAPFGVPRSSADTEAGARDFMYGISVRF